MDRRGIERELEALTRRDLIQLASELEVKGRHRMKKDQLIQTIMVARVYKSLPDSPDILYRLTREDLLRMCEWIGVEAKKGARKGYLVERIRAQQAEGKPEGSAGLEDLPPTVNGDLPEGYGETRIVLLPVDPYLVHVYWELSGSEKRRVKRLLSEEPPHFKSVLRFRDVTALPVGGFHKAGTFDVEIRMETHNWYVRLLSPERSYVVDLGLRGKDGRFHPIVRSNRGETPRAWPCEEAGHHLMRVVEWGGGVHVDHLAGRQHARGATPISQMVAKGPQLRPVTEGHRAVVGLPSVGVRTSMSEGTPKTKPSHRPDEAVEEPLFASEEEPGKAKPAPAPLPGGQAQESTSLQSAGPDDARDGPEAKFGETRDQKKRKRSSEGEGGAQSGPPPSGQQESTESDLSLWCEDQFVSGLSSKQMASAEERNDKD
jgi:hypothetical protein